jgi:hypothetical protein
MKTEELKGFYDSVEYAEQIPDDKEYLLLIKQNNGEGFLLGGIYSTPEEAWSKKYQLFDALAKYSIFKTKNDFALHGTFICKVKKGLYKQKDVNIKQIAKYL